MYGSIRMDSYLPTARVRGGEYADNFAVFQLRRVQFIVRILCKVRPQSCHPKLLKIPASN